MPVSSASTSPLSTDQDSELFARLQDPAIRDDVLAYVMFAYPWGKEGTILHDRKGPRAWQAEQLDEMSAHLERQRWRMANDLPLEIYQEAIASGRGPGKSALLAWRADWMRNCVLGSTTIIAANSEPQLRSRTFAEITKWTTLSITSHWWTADGLTVRPVKWFSEALSAQRLIDPRWYYTQGQLWTEEAPERFAGVHNPYGLLVQFDEASGIPKPIWVVTKGFYTERTPYRFFCAYSNSRHENGEFEDLFPPDGAQAHKWQSRRINSLEVEDIEKGPLLELIETYGEDSDEARVEVFGMSPKSGTRQFIARELVREAFTNPSRNAAEYNFVDPLIIGVDVARFGDDVSVIWFRQGLDARSIPPVVLRGKDGPQVATEVAHWTDRLDPDAVCVDGTAVGASVVDHLRFLKYKIHDIGFGMASDDPKWANKRTEIWANMRDWLRRPGVMIPKHDRLIRDLCGPIYRLYEGKGDKTKIILEPKEEMKTRGLSSPDYGDALALTFAVPVASRKVLKNPYMSQYEAPRVVDGVDYPLYD